MENKLSQKQIFILEYLGYFEEDIYIFYYDWLSNNKNSENLEKSFDDYLLNLIKEHEIKRYYGTTA